MRHKKPAKKRANVQLAQGKEFFHLFAARGAFFLNTISIWSVGCVCLAVAPAPRVNLKGKVSREFDVIS